MNVALIKTLTLDELELLDSSDLDREQLLAVVEQYKKLIELVLNKLNS